MARMVSNIDDEIRRLDRLQVGVKSKAMPAMLRAGASVYVREWKRQISEGKHIHTGSMLSSVDMSEPKLTIDGGSIAIYPQDVDGRGVRNAVKAFVLVNGKRSSRRGIYRKNQKTPDKRFKGNRPDAFVTRAEDAASAQADAEMQRVLDDFIGGGNNV